MRELSNLQTYGNLGYLGKRCQFRFLDALGDAVLGGNHSKDGSVGRSNLVGAVTPRREVLTWAADGVRARDA
jgi:hypothetical protein